MSKTIHPFLRIALLGAAVILMNIAGAANRPNDTLPMYGQPKLAPSPKTEQLDQAFIEQATASTGGDREAAARAARDDAERLMGEGNADEAMRRFNQAWLLGPSDFQPFWGFGRIQLMRNNIDEAIDHFTKAAQLTDDNVLKSLVLADDGIAHSLKASRATAKSEKNKLFAKANELFQQSTDLDGSNGSAWLRWSQSLFREAKYADAWKRLKKAEEAGARIPKSYVGTLSEKMPEPK
jgi:tetratricopeptide (TPR) repeat protein